MNRLILTPIVVLWVALTTQAQFYNNGLITNNSTLITDSQLPWVNAANGVFNGTGTNGVFEHRGPSAQTFTNNGTYSATAGHTDRFSGPGGSAGSQEIAGNRQPQFHNLHLNNGSSGVINITNTAGVLVSNQVTFANGITTTVRTNPTAGALRLGVGASYTGGTTDAQHVNGYVTKTGNTEFTFPVGSGTDVRTLAVSAPNVVADQYSVAWIAGDPTTTPDPTGTPALHPTASRDAAAINRVSPAGQWDWVAASGTGDGLTISVSIPDMTAFGDEISLRLVGWNGTRWINLSTGPRPYLGGTSYASDNTANSTLVGTLVAGITAIGIGEFPSQFQLGGTVFYDGNGLTDGRVDRNGNGPIPLNGTDFDPLTAGAQALYTTLVNNNSPVTTVPVTAAGTFSFNSVAPGTYSVVLSTNPAGSTVPVLPANFMNTGERYSFDIDGTPNGIVTGIRVTNASLSNLLFFGINRQPVAKSTQVPPQPTPASGVQISVPATAFGGVDLEDGPLPSPGNSTYSYDLQGREVTLRPATGGTLYYLGNPVNAPLVIPNFETDRVTVSAANAQTTSVSFPYTIRDQAGFASNNSSINLPFTGPAPSISGVVFDDGNGRGDNQVNGTPLNGTAVPPITGAPVPLYVSLSRNLAQGGTALVATVPVTATGAYTFSNVAINSSYNIVLTTNLDGNASVASLPTDWVSTGEFVASQGNDLTINGILAFVPVATTPVVNANFGINRRPQVSSATDVVRLNPAGAVPVSANLLIGSDLEDGPYPNNMAGRTVSLSAATGGTLFHNGQRISTVTGFVNGFVPSELRVDPTDSGATTVTFAYQIQDNAGVFSAPGIISVPFGGATVSLSGQVFNDGNGLTDNLVNQTGQGPNPLNGTDFDPAVAGSQSLFATLVNSGGTALGTVPVTVTGNYSFAGVSAGTYSVVLGTSAAGSTTPALPATWVNTGEKLGTGTGSDGTPDGILTGVVVGTDAVDGANFGINKRPTGATASVPTQPNPGGNAQVAIPATAFTGTDLEDGPYANNLTGREVTLTPASGGTLYYAGNPVSTNTAVANFDPSRVTIDPTSTQATTVQFTYLLRDNAGTPSNPALTSSSIFVPFTGDPIVISGTIFDDANGQTDNTVNGVAINGPALPSITGAPVPLYVSLALEATLIATVPVSAAGTYSFNDVGSNRAYNVVLTTNPAGDVISSTLPTGWVNTGAFVGTGPGNTGTFPGVQGVSVGTSSISNANFGIDRRPEGAAVTLAPQANPGGNEQVPVPATAFTGIDLEDGTYPNNLAGRAVTLGAGGGGTLYYNSAPVSTLLAITSFDPTKVSLDPTALATTTAAFTYSLRDNAGVASLPVTVTVPLQPTFNIAGRVVNDGNGLTDNTVNQVGQGPNPLNGTDIDPQVAGNQSLYAVLYRDDNGIPDEDEEIVDVQPVAPNGSYVFYDQPASSYSVLLSTDPAGSLSPSLPQGWASTGENLGTEPGSDGQPNGRLYLASYQTEVSEANFGISKRPVANSIALNPLANPGGSNRVPIAARAFSGSDLEDGPYANNLRGRPVTLNPATGGRLYYDDAEVIAPLEVDEFDPDDVDVDPDADGESFVAFSYATGDDAGIASEPASVTQPFTEALYRISGRVFNDGNGLTDNLVNQVGQGPSPLNGADIDPQVAGNQRIYALLLRDVERVFPRLVATSAVTNTGTYSFSGLPGGVYQVVVGIDTTVTNIDRIATLPEGWNFTGKQLGTGPTSADGLGRLDVLINNANVSEANFGINKLPLAMGVTLPEQPNPGDSVLVPVPLSTFTGSDFEDGTYPNGLTGRRVRFEAFSGGTLYQNGNRLPNNPFIQVVIDPFDPTQFAVNPFEPGATTVTFKYSVLDEARVASLPVTVKLPFTAPKFLITGRVFNDGNGLADGFVNQIGNGPNPLNGRDIDPLKPGDQALYAVLDHRRDGVREVVDVAPVDDEGAYEIDVYVPTDSDGAFSVFLTTDPTGQTQSLPQGWVNTGEFLGTGPGNDGQADGRLYFADAGPNYTYNNANFGIDQQPVVTAGVASQLNPGVGQQVPVPVTVFSGTDFEDDPYDNNLTDRPVSLTRAVNGTLYYDGNPVTISLAIARFDPTKVTLSPTREGSLLATFTYAVKDDAGVLSDPKPISFTFRAAPISISGTIFDDANGQTDNTVNGVAINGPALPSITGAPVPLYVSLALEATLIATVPVTAAGTYSFNDVVDNQVYDLVLTTNPAGDVISSTLPAGWVNTGAFVGTGPGNTGTFPGVQGVSVGDSSVSNANFGIDRRPEGAAVTLAPQANPGGNEQVPVPAAAFTGIDLEDGTYPNNLAGRAVTLGAGGGGTLYYNSAPVSTLLAITSFDPTKVSLDPTALATTTAAFTYSLRDNAGVASLPVTVTVPLQPTFNIAGRVVNDGNGLTDNTVNQTGQGPNPLNGADIDGNLAGNQALFATLVSSSGASLTTVAVSNTGTYSFGGLTADTYSVVLSTNEPGSLVSALPANWVSTGEQLGTGPGSDGTVDGILMGIVVSNTSLGDANFGIDQRPAGADVRLASQDNPGGTVQVPVPATVFTGSDLEDGTYTNNLAGRAVTLSAATGGTLYYNSVPLNTTLAIARFDPTQVSLDPTAQDSTTVSFTYQVRDSAGVSSAPATITLPFGSPRVSISGNVLNDGNGLRDELVNGPGINGPALPVYVSLLDGARLIETVSVNVSGFFNFLSVQANKAYKLILNTLAGGSQTPSLPEKWVNTGESLPEANQTLSTPGSGATVSQPPALNRVDNAADGVIELRLQTSGVSDVIFGIEQRPAGANVTLAAQSNPGGTVQASVSATAFTGTDLEDGTYPNNLAGRAVHLNPATGGTLYYNSTPVSTSVAITSFDPTNVTLDPAAQGSTTTSFTYQVQDNAGLSSPPATITLPFTGPAAQLSGNVFNDANGLADNLVNGTGANGPALPLYVSLVNSGVVATVPVTDAGAYSFTGVGSGTYSVVLTTNSGGSATASLPANWVSTGEQLGTGPGSDGTPNGLLTGIRVGTSDVAAANFGIDRKPVVASGAMPPLSNPGGTNRSTVFASVFAGSDPEDGTYANNLSGREVTLTAATGGTLYYNGSPVSGAGVITNFDPAQVTLDPTAQKETVVTFAVAVKDNAGVLSDPKPIVVPFSDDQDEEDENDDPDEDDGNEDPDDDDDGDNDDDGQRDDRVRLPTNTFTPTIPTIRLPLPIGVPPIPLIGILITVFPINAISIIINGTVYTRDTFPPEGVIVRTNEDGDLEDDLVIEPEDPTKPVPIPFVGVGPTGTPVTSPGNTNAQPATLINNGPLSCTNTTVTLTAGGTGTYRFSAGATPVAGGNTATVTGAGTYYVIVTGPNGYQARAATIVTADQSVPAATLTASGPLSCSTTSVTLTAGGVGTYRFSAGATQIAGGNTATVTQAGIYEVTVTAANGCRATASVRVVADQSVPAATLINNGPLSCTNTTVTLTAGGTGTYRFSAGATQIGTGPTATVTEAGVYSVTVTATNGCSATAQTTVNSTSDAPLRIINQPVSSSIVTVGATVTASVSVTGTGPVGYQWYKDGATPVVGQTSAVLTLPNVQRSDAGRYMVVVSGPCNSGVSSLTSTAFTLTVNPNPLTLNVVATPDTLLTTETTRLTATALGGTAPYSYSFSGPGTITATGNTATVASLSAGVQTFTVVARDTSLPTSQTVSATVSVTVSEPNTPPRATINLSQTAIVNEDFSYEVNAFTDAETPNSLTYTARISPANGLSFDPATRELSGTPLVVGVSSVTITATDPGSLTASTTFLIVVRQPQSTTGLVISQIYGSGGEPGAAYRNDFVELFNRSDATIDVSGWSVQYANATGAAWQSTPLTGSIPAGGYYLVQGAAGSSTAVTTSLPTPDATGTINVSETAGKVALVKVSTALSGTCPTGTAIVDFVGYGTANCYEGPGAALGSPTGMMAYFRKVNGCTDTDDNTADFAVSAVLPRNSASPVNVCGAVTSLSLTVSASPSTLLTTGTTTLSARVAGGTSPYSYTFSGPGTISQTPASNTATVTSLTAGVQTFTVVVSDASTPASQTISATVSVTVTNPLPVNTAPVSTTNASQTATVGVAFAYTVNAFTDAQTPNSLTYTASINPANGLSFNPATRVISGTPVQAGLVSVTVTATDSGSLSASTSFSINVQPAMASLVATLSGSTTICAGSSAALRVSLTGGTAPYTVVYTDGVRSATVSGYTSGAGISVSPVLSTTYALVSVTDSVGTSAQSLSGTAVVTVSPLPVARISGALTVCLGQRTTLTASDTVGIAGVTYRWNTGATTAAISATTGTYSVTITTANGCTATASVTVSPSSVDFGPLVDLYNSTGGANWTRKDNWLTGCTPCNWYGVSCDGNGRVTGLSLLGNNLTGTLPASLSGLTPLTLLELGDNGLVSGGIPGGLSSLTGLQTLNLSRTQLGGSIPDSFGALVNLERLFLNESGLTGAIPASLGGLTRLQDLQVYANQLTGCFPNSLSALCGNRVVNFANNPGLPGGGDFGAFCSNGTGSCTPINTAPVATANPSQTAIVGQPFAYTVAAFTDAQTPNSLTYSASISPANGLSFNPATRVISGVPSTTGVSRVTITATDSGSLSASTSFSITVQPVPVVVPPLTVTLTASPTTVLTTGTTTLSATVTGGTEPYTYTFNGLGIINGSPGSNTATASGLTVGVQTLNVLVTDATLPTSQRISATVSVTVTEANTAPTVANVIPPQSATVSQAFSYVIPAATFTDAQTPNALVLSVSGLPQGISFTAPATLSGTPSVSGVSSVTVTATDPAGLSVSTTFSLTVSPAGTTPNPTAPFAITGVTTLSCTPVGNQISLSFTPRYAGATGQPISFSVANELAPTTAAGPYTLRLFADNPVISLKATQTGTAGEASFAYNWLAACNSQAPGNTAPTVANVIPAQVATVGQVFSYSIPASTFTDAQTPNALVLSVSGLPQGISFTSPATLSGTPSLSGVSSVTVTATDPAGLSVSTTFILTVNPAGTTPNPTVPFAITGVTTLSCTPVGNQISLSFTPQYAGLSGQPISFSVANELAPTTNPGPYTLRLFADNPVITLKATQTGTAGEATFSYNWLAACNSQAPGNTAPTVANPIPAQSATVGQVFSYVVPAATFTDAQTPNALMLSVSGLPAGISFTSPATLSGTPSLSGVSSVTVTATDPAGLSVSTTFSLTVSPAGTTPNPTAPFAITGVTTLSCTPVGNQISLSFTPRYAGATGQPISFSVANELAPTTAPGPYTLRLFADNPVITLKATQTGTAGEATFSYNWLAACNSQAPGNTAPTVANPIPAQSATVGQVFSYSIPASTFTDAQTPNALSLSVSGLPTGISFTAPATLSGTPSLSGVSSVTVTATDPAGLSVSTTFSLTVSPAGTTPSPTAPFAITGVTTLSCTPVGNQISLSFTPQYAGATGQPISFSVANELAPTTAPGPYTLRLFADNPVISLKATQTGTAGEASFAYNWLAACQSGARLKSESEPALEVVVLGNPVVGSEVTVDVRGAKGQPLRLQLSNLQGRAVSERIIEQAGSVERVTLDLGNESGGILLLRVSTTTQSRTVKVIRNK